MRAKRDGQFWTKVDVGHPLGCWEWLAATDGHGYGVFRFEGRVIKAHRVAFLLLRGSLPEGLPLDHVCRNTRCVNPDHLEPVTHRENMQRGVWSKRRFCPNGHEYDHANTRWTSRGDRKCRQCHRDHERKRRETVALARTGPEVD